MINRRTQNKKGGQSTDMTWKVNLTPERFAQVKGNTVVSLRGGVSCHVMSGTWAKSCHRNIQSNLPYAKMLKIIPNEDKYKNNHIWAFYINGRRIKLKDLWTIIDYIVENPNMTLISEPWLNTEEKKKYSLQAEIKIPGYSTRTNDRLLKRCFIIYQIKISLNVSTKLLPLLQSITMVSGV